VHSYHILCRLNEIVFLSAYSTHFPLPNLPLVLIPGSHYNFSVTEFLTKPHLRDRARNLRQAQDTNALSAQIVARLRALPEIMQARDVLIYLAMPDEVNIDALVEDQTKRWYVPVCVSKTQLQIHRYIPGETPVRTSEKGLRQPTEGVPASPDNLDAVILPGLMFSERGERLGYGAGYYDRWLRRLPPTIPRIGVTFEACVLPELPHEAWDERLHIVITESRVIRIFP